MASEDSSKSDSTTQVVTIQGDNSNFSTGIKLDEHNYSLWHQVMEMKIAGREKHGYLTGDMTQPAATDQTYNKWRASDCQVKSWLFDAMKPDQMKRFIRYDTTKQVWDAIKKTYSDGSDEAKIYDLHRRSFTMKQNGAPVANYYSELTEIFQELDQLSPSNMKDPADIETRRKEVDRLRVYIFLAGLDNIFDQIRGEILRMEPKPELEAAYAHIKRESNRQGTMSEASVSSDATVLVAARFKQSRLPTQNTDSTRNRPPMKCTKCGLDNHTIKGCYEIIGYPEGWVHKGRKRDSRRASFASSESSQETISESPSGTSGSKALATSGSSHQGRDWMWY
ncbi:retrovirus-related Pol polyprotein from transposon TNT 1-94 [Cinnamomum micranthum f. kanehirae]|uniref:Retrovirus-related Pol polyprotein from transposon TNT 1-94 n=1 Tax=Cinnamomum micranthum f. kanehirae TaxID=337451 RepID=A0A3S3MJB6_9MAGN|nr:retrovirus-related Pol polyprotein from transposon TNT 1-94 [Cinnamomum micranthum f. kanehirae]